MVHLPKKVSIWLHKTLVKKFGRKKAVRKVRRIVRKAKKSADAPVIYDLVNWVKVPFFASVSFHQCVKMFLCEQKPGEKMPTHTDISNRMTGWSD